MFPVPASVACPSAGVGEAVRRSLSAFWCRWSASIRIWSWAFPGPFQSLSRRKRVSCCFEICRIFFP